MVEAIDHGATPTAITDEAIKQIIDSQLSLPDGFTVHPRLLPQLQRRAAMVAGDAIDWATGELLAFGTVLMDGHTVRLVGQDTRRGTFGQRHAVLVDRHTAAGVHPAAPVQLGHREVPRLRLAAVGVRGGGLRVRLLGRPPRRARRLGGAVR